MAGGPSEGLGDVLDDVFELLPDQAIRCAQYPWKELAWDQAHCRYLMGLYYGT
jgi:hypothetical protein